MPHPYALPLIMLLDAPLRTRVTAPLSTARSEAIVPKMPPARAGPSVTSGSIRAPDGPGRGYGPVAPTPAGPGAPP